MSKNEGPARDGPWDARRAFHDATKVVYKHLCSLVDTISNAPSMRSAFLELDAIIANHSAPERGDSHLTVALKQGVGRLRDSLATADEIKRTHHEAARAFWLGRNVDRNWGGVGTASHHDVALGAASALVERNRPSDTIRDHVFKFASDQEERQRLAGDLDHEFELTQMLPPLRPVATAGAGTAERFYEVALATADASQSIAQMLFGFPTAAVEVTRQLPDALIGPVHEQEAASMNASLARVRYHDAASRDTWSREAFDQLAQALRDSADAREQLKLQFIKQYKADWDAAEVRLQRASESLEQTRVARREAEQAITTEWLRQRRHQLRSTLSEFRALLGQFRPRVAGLPGVKTVKLGPFGEVASACAALEKFAVAAVQEVASPGDFEGLDPEQLRVAVEEEIGVLVRSAQGEERRLRAMDAISTKTTTVTSRKPLEVLYALHDLLVDASSKDERAGADAHALIFGNGNLYADLASIAKRKDEYVQAFGGSTQPTIKWAPCNGHHALAWWCEMLANLTKVRSETIPRVRADLDDARKRGDQARVLECEGSVRKAEVYFATAIDEALGPLLKDYDWIHQSLRREVEPQSHGGPAGERGQDASRDWVPAALCIGKLPDLKDHTAVRRFCRKHGIETRKQGGRRRSVHWPSFQKALKLIEKKDEEFGDIADRVRTERERKEQKGSGQ